MSDPADYTMAELMVATAASELRDGESVFVGLGLPSPASHLAKRTHAHGLQLVYEAGIVGSDPEDDIPRGISGPKLVTGAAQVMPMIRVFDTMLQGGKIDVGFLGGAQVDRFGNVNSTAIGDYDDPAARWGSGGACTIACNAGRTLIVMPHEPRRFPAEVDFVTSPGYLGNGETRDDYGLQGGGPSAIITTKAIMRFDEAGEAYVSSLHPGVSRAEVREATGWDLRFGDDVGETPAPTAEAVRLLREEIDPDRNFFDAGDGGA